MAELSVGWALHSQKALLPKRFQCKVYREADHHPGLMSMDSDEAYASDRQFSIRKRWEKAFASIQVSF